MSALWSILTRGFMLIWPWLALVAGATLTIMNYESNNALRSIGIAIIGSGVLASLFRCWQYFGVFSAAIEDVLISDKHLNRLNESALAKTVINSWTALAKLRGVSNPNAREMIGGLAESAIATFAPVAMKPVKIINEAGEWEMKLLRSYFVTEYDRTIELSWHDKSRGEIFMKDTIKATMVSATEEDGFDFITRSSILSKRTNFNRQRAEAAVSTKSSMKINGKAQTYNYRYRHEGLAGRENVIESFAVAHTPVEERQPVAIERVLQKTTVLAEDPYIRFHMPCPTLSPRFAITCQDNLCVTILTLGLLVKNMANPGLNLEQQKQVDIQIPGTVCENQGLIVIIHAV